MRGIMSCPDAGIGLEEPFDCYPDARMLQDSILSRTPGLDTKMPQRINVAFGGCAACRDHARLNALSFVSRVPPEGELRYECGMGGGVRPQRVPGWAMVTVNVPLGDLDTEDFRELASLADTVGDEHIYFTRNQNAMFRHVRIEEVPFVRKTLAALGLGLEDADQARDVRVCAGVPVRSLARA